MSTILLFPGLRESAEASGLGHLGFVFILVGIAVWSLVWKGFALWYAARNHQNRWFIALLILNTLGVLEIVYLIWFRADKDETRTKSLFNNPVEPEEDSSGI